MNQATHFLDGSHIYGSNSRDAAALREKTGGLLKTSAVEDEELLPLSANPTEKCMVENDSGTCFNAGKISIGLVYISRRIGFFKVNTKISKYLNVLVICLF